MEYIQSLMYNIIILWGPYLHGVIKFADKTRFKEISRSMGWGLPHLDSGSSGKREIIRLS